MNSGTLEDLLDVWGNADDRVFMVGTNGIILYYNGNDWKQMASGTQYTLRDVWGLSENNVFAVGHSGAILRFIP